MLSLLLLRRRAQQYEFSPFTNCTDYPLLVLEAPIITIKPGESYCFHESFIIGGEGDYSVRIGTFGDFGWDITNESFNPLIVNLGIQYFATIKVQCTDPNSACRIQVRKINPSFTTISKKFDWSDDNPNDPDDGGDDGYGDGDDGYGEGDGDSQEPGDGTEEGDGTDHGDSGEGEGSETESGQDGETQGGDQSSTQENSHENDQSVESSEHNDGSSEATGAKRLITKRKLKSTRKWKSYQDELRYRFYKAKQALKYRKRKLYNDQRDEELGEHTNDQGDGTGDTGDGTGDTGDGTGDTGDDTGDTGDDTGGDSGGNDGLKEFNETVITKISTLPSGTMELVYDSNENISLVTYADFIYSSPLNFNYKTQTPMYAEKTYSANANADTIELENTTSYLNLHKAVSSFTVKTSQKTGDSKGVYKFIINYTQQVNTRGRVLTEENENNFLFPSFSGTVPPLMKAFSYDEIADPQPPEEKKGNLGLTIGLCIAGVAFVALLSGILILLVFRNKKRKIEAAELSPPEDNASPAAEIPASASNP